MDGIEYLGLVATSLATFAFLPQVLKTWRTRSANDFSLSTLVLLEAGTCIWIVYGVLRNAPAIWIGNSITLALAGFILAMKVENALANRRGRQWETTRAPLPSHQQGTRSTTSATCTGSSARC